MTTIYSADGITVDRVYGTAPARHWVQDTPDEGHYEPADVANGYFPLVEVARPSPDHARSVERDGDTFVEVWTFDQANQDARLDSEDREAKRATVGGAVATLRQWADDAAATTVTSGNVVAVTQTMATRLGVFFDRFADLIEAQRLDQ